MTVTTPAQTAANKANAQYSTGPKTETGISRSSMNNSATVSLVYS